MSAPAPERKQHSMGSQDKSSQYFLDIYNSSAAKQTAFAFGDLAEITFIARRRIAEMNGKGDTMRVKLVEIEPGEIGSFGKFEDLDAESGPIVKREVAVFEGDADTAAQALKRKLAAEKKQQQEGADGPPPAPGGMPTPESEQAAAELFGQQ